MKNKNNGKPLSTRQAKRKGVQPVMNPEVVTLQFDMHIPFGERFRMLFMKKLNVMFFVTTRNENQITNAQMKVARDGYEIRLKRRKITNDTGDVENSPGEKEELETKNA